jgi:hypothetical protein
MSTGYVLTAPLARPDVVPAALSKTRVRAVAVCVVAPRLATLDQHPPELKPEVPWTDPSSPRQISGATSPRRSLAMAPKRRGARAAPTAKRGRAGDSQRLEADADAIGEPPLAVAKHPQRLIRFHRSEDDKVFVELTSMWRWFSGNLKSTKGDARLAKTLRRRGYNGASFTAPTDGPGDVRHVELRVANRPKIYPVANEEALKDLLRELDQDVIDTNYDVIWQVFQRMGSEPGPLATHYPQVAFVENGNKLAVVKRPGCKPRLALFALLKCFAPGYEPSDLFYRKGLREFLVACGVREPSCSTLSRDRVLHEGAGEGRRRIIFDLETISEHEKAAGAKSEGLSFVTLFFWMLWYLCASISLKSRVAHVYCSSRLQCSVCVSLSLCVCVSACLRVCESACLCVCAHGEKNGKQEMVALLVCNALLGISISTSECLQHVERRGVQMLLCRLISV